MTRVCGYPCSNRSGGPLPPTSASISTPSPGRRRRSKPSITPSGNAGSEAIAHGGDRSSGRSTGAAERLQDAHTLPGGRMAAQERRPVVACERDRHGLCLRVMAFELFERSDEGVWVVGQLQRQGVGVEL